MEKIKFLFLATILSPFILIIIFISPFLKIRIGRIQSRLIGHMTIHQEIYLCEKEEGLFKKKKEIILWFHDKKIANRFLLNYWKKKMIILPGYILSPIQNFFIIFKFTERFIYYKVIIKNQNKKIIDGKKKDTYKLLEKYQPFIKFTNKEIDFGIDFLKKNSIKNDENFVCFSNRSADFKNENFESSRNFSISDLSDGINYLLSKDYKAVRMGRKVKENLLLNNKNVFDYAKSNMTNDFLDFFIFSKCKFMITAESGISEIPTLFRIPKLNINYVLFNNICNMNEKYLPIILPKKVFCKKEKKLIKFEQAFDKKLFDNYNTKEKFEINNYMLIDNTKEEILEATKEMYALIELKSFDIKSFRLEQDFFWKKFDKYYNYRPENLIISPSFFQKNIKLF